MDISVVIPLYNEEESIPELHAWIERVMSDLRLFTSRLFIASISSKLISPNSARRKRSSFVHCVFAILQV